MLSIQGFIAKELKKQEKLPEKFNDIILEPKYTRIGKCYTEDGTEITDWTVAPMKAFSIVTSLKKDLPYNLYTSNWELTYYFSPPRDVIGNAYVYRNRTNGGYVGKMYYYSYSNNIDKYKMHAYVDGYKSSANSIGKLKVYPKKDTLYVAMGLNDKELYCVHHVNMTEWQSQKSWDIYDRDPSEWSGFVSIPKSGINANVWEHGAIKFDACHQPDYLNLIPDNIKLVVDGEVVFKGKNRV